MPIGVRRLRDALPAGPVRLRPSTPLAGLRGGHSDRDRCREAGARSGVDLHLMMAGEELVP